MKHDDIKEIAIREQFTVPDWLDRQRCIVTLRNYAVASVAAAKALATIRDKKLYLPHKNLKEFCERECGFTEQRLFQIINFSKIRESLPEPTKQLLSRENQARELSKVPESKRVEVLDEAKRFHAKNGKITAKSIKKASDQVETGPVDKSGVAIPPEALPFWNRRQEIQDILNHISAARSQIRNASESDPLYHRIGRFGEIGRELDSIYQQFKGILPEYVCGYCHGQNIENCRGCNGVGLLSEYLRKNLPTHVPEQPF